MIQTEENLKTAAEKTDEALDVRTTLVLLKTDVERKERGYPKENGTNGESFKTSLSSKTSEDVLETSVSRTCSKSLSAR